MKQLFKSTCLYSANRAAKQNTVKGDTISAIFIVMVGFVVVSYRLSPAEVAFLREYGTTMKPLVKASNILQSEFTSFMGWLLPVIQQPLSKLSRLETKSNTYLLPLIRALQNGLQKRFGPMMEDPELAAAELLPKFKTSWTDRADVTEAGKASFFFQRFI